jgi:hypothetical protein
VSALDLSEAGVTLHFAVPSGTGQVAAADAAPNPAAR